MNTTTLSSRGQIVLPKHIRASRGWEPGDQFTVEETPYGILLRPIVRFPETAIDDVAGCLKSKRKPATLSRMSRAIDREVARRQARGRY